ncbi:MAG: hypothetical protein PHD05_00905 [Sphaerochaetaceae bacterium]|nr:hypothetical protein [Sphaerochaetaceae bacterium]
MGRQLVLCDAVPFCFGPISKLIAVAEHLKSSDFELVLLASGTSKELGEKSGLFQVIDCNSEDPVDLENNLVLFQKASVFVTVMNPVAAKFALKIGVPIVFMDSLFWMWDTVPKEFAKIDKYFIQNFFDSKQVLSKYSFLKNAEVVGPIIDDSFKIESLKDDYVVVNFGGMESALIQIGKDSNYPFVIGKIVVEALKKTKKKAFVCGNDKILKQLLVDKPDNIIIGGKGHKEFLNILRKASMLITTPGLTTTFEAFFYTAPAVFLPPENYSQFLNLKIFRNQGIAKKSFHWVDLYNGLDIGIGKEESLGVKKVLDCIKKFEKDISAQKKLLDFLVSALESKVPDVVVPKNYFLSLGESSSTKIADSISKIALGARK